MDHLLGPIAVRARLQLVYDAQSIRAAGGGHSIDVAVTVHGHSRTGSVPIVAAGEAVDYPVFPSSARVGQLENHAATGVDTRSDIQAADTGGAIDIALRVERHALVGFAAIGAAGKAVEHGMNPASGGRR